MGASRSRRFRAAAGARNPIQEKTAMTPLSNDRFAEEVMRLAKPVSPFVPVVTYDPDGDCIEFLAKPDNFYAERIDDLVTVYYSQETREVIGSLIKGVTKYCADMLKR